MYITKADIIKFIASKQSRTTMKELFDLGLLQFNTPLEVTEELLDELIHVDKLVRGSIEPYGTFALTPKGMIYLDNLTQIEQQVLTEQTVQVSQKPLHNSSEENANKKESKAFQMILVILPVLLAFFLPKIWRIICYYVSVVAPNVFTFFQNIS